MGRGVIKTILIGVIVAACIGIGVVVGQQLIGENSKQDGMNVVNVEDVVVFNMEEPIITNLEDGGIIRVALGLGVDSNNASIKKFERFFGTNQVIIRDEIISILRTKTYEEVNRVEAQSEIALELKEMINELLGEEYVYQVYFREFLVQ